MSKLELSTMQSTEPMWISRYAVPSPFFDTF